MNNMHLQLSFLFNSYLSSVYSTFIYNTKQNEIEYLSSGYLILYGIFSTSFYTV